MLCLALGCADPASPAPANARSPHPAAAPVEGVETLTEAIDAAWARAPSRRVLAARQEEASARSERAASPLAGSPSLRARYQSDRLGSDRGLTEYEGGVDLPLWWQGQRDAETDLARSVGEAAERSERGRRLLVAGEVREQVWEVALADNAVRLAEEELQTARALERDIERRVSAGELPRADLLLARQDTLARESTLVQARSEAVHARERYARLTGLDRLPRRYEESRATAEVLPPDHPLLGESEAGVREALARLGAARRTGGGNPVLTLASKHQRPETGLPYDHSVEVIVSVPLGLSSQTGAAIAEAGRSVGQAEADHEALRRALEGALDAAGHELAATVQRLTLAREQARLAREGLRLARIAFASGETDLASLLRVQAQAFAGQRAERQLELERLRGVARYNQALGEMP